MVITEGFDPSNPGSNPGRTCDSLTIAQLEERWTVMFTTTWISIGRWFDPDW